MTKFSKLKTGEKLSETQFYTVVKIKGNQVQLENARKEPIVVDKGYVETCLTSGEQFTTETKVNKTDLTKLFLENANVVFTVSFNKQVKAVDVVKEIKDAYDKSTPSEFETKLKKAVNKGLEGEERVLTGYHNGTQDEFGRVSAVDMNITEGHNVRLVDPRNLNYLILKGTKYIVK